MGLSVSLYFCLDYLCLEFSGNVGTGNCILNNMNRFLFLALLLTAPLAAPAQDYPGKWEVGLFMGILPMSYGDTSFYDLWKQEHTYPDGTLASIYEPGRGKMADIYYGEFPYLGLRFGYRLARWIKVGSDLGWSFYMKPEHIPTVTGSYRPTIP